MSLLLACALGGGGFKGAGPPWGVEDRSLCIHINVITTSSSYNNKIISLVVFLKPESIHSHLNLILQWQ